MKNFSPEQNNTRKTPLINYDKSKLPAQRFLKWLMENNLNIRYLYITEAVLIVSTGICCYLYFAG